MLAAKRWEELTVLARSLCVRYPRNTLGWRALASAQLHGGAMADALDTLSQVMKLTPGDANAHNDMGYAHLAMGQQQAAKASFLQALKLNPRLAIAHNNLGMVAGKMGQLEEAEAAYRKSLAINPDVPAALNNLAAVLQDMARPTEAEPLVRRALDLLPNYYDAWFNLGSILSSLTRWDDAVSAFRQAIALHPDAEAALVALGTLQSKFAERDAESIHCLNRAIAVNPNNAAAYIALANVYLRIKEMPRAWDLYRRAQDLQPFVTWRTKQPTPDFSVLLLDSPGAGSTPVDYLVGQATYNRHFYCVMPQGQHDIALLRSKADVVINMLADADNGQEILPRALELANQLDRPVVNHPSKIMRTDRESMARLLASIPKCHAPRTVRMSETGLAQAVASGGIPGFPMPVVVRLAGTHGGDDMEKVDSWQAVGEFVARHPGQVFYLAEYVDYQSADGWFRKYRLICVDGAWFPYHLAIHKDWKVHYFRTAMVDHAWMREEEEAFLRAPEGVFDQACFDALHAITAASGLEYYGIDCALTNDCCLLVFEANATMLVHDEKEAPFTSKNRYIGNIKIAFDAMLARLARWKKV